MCHSTTPCLHPPRFRSSKNKSGSPWWLPHEFRALEQLKSWVHTWVNNITRNDNYVKWWMWGINSIVVITSQCISNHHTVHFKYTEFYWLITSVNLGKIIIGSFKNNVIESIWYSNWPRLSNLVYFWWSPTNSWGKDGSAKDMWRASRNDEEQKKQIFVKR